MHLPVAAIETTPISPTVNETHPFGATPVEGGVYFKVWAPHADKVFVVGTFNDWKDDLTPLTLHDNGIWAGLVAEAAAGAEYRYLIHNGDLRLRKIDPWAKEVTNSVGNGIITAESSFDWEGDNFTPPPRESMVIYELHTGTFAMEKEGQPATFDQVIARLGHLERLGVNAVEIMPIAEFAGDLSWGYNPAHPFAVESAYGGPEAFKRLVKACHQRGIAVILDVVYNHFGPSDLDLWQFDGWQENGMGGIYFYNDWRSETPWGQTRPDYGRQEVRHFLKENALYWVKEYHLDGLRFDMTLFIRSVDGTGDPGKELAEGWSLAQEINHHVLENCGPKILIAEDLQNNEWLTKTVGEGGAGFTAQWDARFTHPVRGLLISPDDSHRSMEELEHSLWHRYNNDPFQRVIYTESHDEVANGKARVVSEVGNGDDQGYFAKKKSLLGAALACTAPGVPMILQGQEFLQHGWFRDDLPLAWNHVDRHCGIFQAYADLVRLRTNREGRTRGLMGPHLAVLERHEEENVLVYHRWSEGGAGDDVVVVINFSNDTREDRLIPFPHEGNWKLLFNSSGEVYDSEFKETVAGDVIVSAESNRRIAVSLPRYAALIFAKC